MDILLATSIDADAVTEETAAVAAAVAAAAEMTGVALHIAALSVDQRLFPIQQ